MSLAEKKDIVEKSRTKAGFIDREKAMKIAMTRFLRLVPEKDRPKVKKTMTSFINDPRTQAFPLGSVISILFTISQVAMAFGSAGSTVLGQIIFDLGIRIVVRIGQRLPEIKRSIRQFRQEKLSIDSVEELTQHILSQVLRFSVIIPSQVIALSKFINVAVKADKAFDIKTK